MSPTPVRDRRRGTRPLPPDRLVELLISAAIVVVLLIAIIVGIT